MEALIGGGVATLLSLMVLSRAIADNPLYRLAQYLLVGVALGYAGAVLVGQTLVPLVLQATFEPFSLQVVVVLSSAAVLTLMLALRFGRQRASSWANIPLALLFGVGAAIALVGAARGTLVPQLLDSIALRRLQTTDVFALAGTVVLIATVALTLLSFTYRQRNEQPSSLARTIRAIGRGLVLATFGVFFAGAVTTYLSALVAQLQAMADWFTQLGTLF